MKATTLIVGLGSTHGDDQIGWRVAEHLAAMVDRLPHTVAVSVRLASSPSELLDWLDGVDRLIVCDACQNAGAPGTILCLGWPNAQLAALCSSGSHDIGLVEVLALGEQLGRLPKEVSIWCAQGEASIPGSSLSATGRTAVTRLVDEIYRQMRLRSAAT